MSYLRNPSQNTYEKCQRILSMFNEINTQSEKKQNNRINTSAKKNTGTYYLAQSTSKKSSTNQLNRNNSKSKTALKYNTSLFNHSSINPVHKEKQTNFFRQKSNSSFVSSYKKQSRLEQIMKLKVSKPSIATSSILKTNKKTLLLNKSMSSLNSSRSSLNKQNDRRNCNKQSRLEKIMNIKVQKPKVNSTLIGYEPRKDERSRSKSLSKKNSLSGLNNNSIIELKQCKKKIKKSQQINEKQDRLWKLFQRQREIQIKQNKRREQSYYKQQRRKQQKFQKLVHRELKNIQNSREVSLRKQGGFSTYVYPSY